MANSCTLMLRRSGDAFRAVEDAYRAERKAFGRLTSVMTYSRPQPTKRQIAKAEAAWREARRVHNAARKKFDALAKAAYRCSKGR